MKVEPTPLRTFDGYTLEELELRKRRAVFALIAPAALTVPGVTLLALGMRDDCGSDGGWTDSKSCENLRAAGLVLTIAGGVGMITTTILVGVCTHKLKLATRDYTLDELELRVKRAKIGLYVSAGALAVGAMMAGIAYSQMGDWGEPSPEWTDPVAWTGVALKIGGFVGLITAGPLLHTRKRQLRKLQETQRGEVRRVQWDPIRWQLVF